MAASPERTWEALLRTAGGAFGGRAKSAFARALGCDEPQRTGDAGTRGSTLVGFRVAESDPPRLLGLEGRHRFSRYRLAFEVEPSRSGSRVTATTHAEFPGPHGKAYRALVIGTRGHVLVTTRLLRAVRRRAER